MLTPALFQDLYGRRASRKGSWRRYREGKGGTPLYQQGYMFGYLQDGFGPEKWGTPKSNTQSLLIIIREPMVMTNIAIEQ